MYVTLGLVEFCDNWGVFWAKISVLLCIETYNLLKGGKLCFHLICIVQQQHTEGTYTSEHIKTLMVKQANGGAWKMICSDANNDMSLHASEH
jgi:hypothetical protein